MDFGSFVSSLSAQPWFFAVPFVAAVFADWGLGSVIAKADGTFSKENVFDWVKTTVGFKQATAVVGSVVAAYFLNGQHAALLALVPLITINGAAFVVVLSDIKEKIAELISPPKPVVVPNYSPKK